VTGNGGAQTPPPPVQADVTAAPQGSASQPTIGPSRLTPQQFAALTSASIPSVPQGLQAVVQNIMNPNSRLGGAAAALVPGVGAAQAGKTAAQLANAGHPALAALTAIPALLPPEFGGGLLRKLGGAAGDAAEEAAPFAIHAADSDHPTLAPRYEFTHPQTGQPNELVLAAEDGGKTLRVNNVGPVRTNYATAPTDANTVGVKNMMSIAKWLAKQHPQAQQLIGDRGDGRTASVDLTQLR
jgi:hypothetical protein